MKKLNLKQIGLILIISIQALNQTKLIAQDNRMKQSKTIVFIHGLFMNPESWNNWVKFYENKGYNCYTPAYPFHEGNPLHLRTHIDQRLKHLTFEQTVDSLIKFIDRLKEKPILIGHSMGGLIVQKLIEHNKGTLGICIDPAPPHGIFSYKWSFLKSNIATINPLKGNSICFPSNEWFHYSFCNEMSLEESRIEYRKYVVPESRNIARTSIKKRNKINFLKSHVPLLIIGGEKDHIIPASLNKKNMEAYKNKNSVIEYKEFQGRTHYLCNQANWEEIADYISNWIGKFNS